jgi:hypothetical protein
MREAQGWWRVRAFMGAVERRGDLVVETGGPVGRPGHNGRDVESGKR